MRLESKALLFDIERAATLLLSFVSSKTREAYLSDAMLRSAVERQLVVLGEAANKLSKLDVETACRISEYRKLVNFRNVLVHGYADVDDDLVWDLVQTKLPTLLTEVRALLGSANDGSEA